MSEILKWVEKIKTQEQNLLLKTTELENLKEDIEFASLKIENEIREEKDVVTGKAVYSNESSRKNELKKRIYEKFKDDLKKARELKLVLDEMKIELKYSMNIFSALKAMLRAKET